MLLVDALLCIALTNLFFPPLSTSVQAGTGTVPLRFLAQAGISLPELNPPNRGTGVRAGSDHGGNSRRQAPARSPSPISEPDNDEDDDDDDDEENGEDRFDEEEEAEAEETIEDNSVELVSVSILVL